jgi:protein-glutamine gamma-glutamyltransferase
MVKIRKILTVLTVCIAVTGYLPLQAYLDPFARIFFPVALVVGLFLEQKGTPLSGRILTPFSILLFLYFASAFSLNSIIQVTADLLVVFLGVRMLGEKSGRNYLQVFALSLFCLAASSLYNLSALFLAYLLILLLLLAVSLVVLTFHAHDPEIALQKPELKKVLTVSGLMPVASLPILLFLFVLLPRTQFPLWDFLNHSAAKKSTGFTDQVKPGSASTVSAVKSVVLRAMSEKVPEQKLYWRGIVLNGFNGDTWIRLPAPPEQAAPTRGGQKVHQEIYPEPSQVPYLLGLNVPRSVSGLRYSESGDIVYQTARPLDTRVKYEVVSVLTDAMPVRGEIDRGFYLTLPATVSPRLREKARELAQPGSSAADKVAKVEQFFRGQRLSYATTGLPTGPDPIDQFLFVKKRGHCELFASSCATLLRLAGVPTRLVGGYHGGTYSEVGGYYLVTEDMAHVWVEAYEEGKGWVFIDPSAWSAGFAHNEEASRRIRMYVDALGFYWNKAVITYDLDKQIALVRTAGRKARSIHFPVGLWRPVAAAGLALFPLGVLLVWYLRGPRSSEERVLRRFLRAVRRRYPAVRGEPAGLFDLAERTGDPKIGEFAEIYGASVYRDRRLHHDEIAKLKGIIRALREHPA